MNMDPERIIRMSYLPNRFRPNFSFKCGHGNTARTPDQPSRIEHHVLRKPHSLPHAGTTSGQEDPHHHQPRLWLRGPASSGLPPAPGNMADRLGSSNLAVHCCESYSAG